MTTLLPRSLAGRLMVVLGLALLVAQVINFALILNERQKLSLSQNVGPAVTRFASAAADINDAEPQFRSLLVQDLSRRGAQYSLSSNSVGSAARATDVEARLSEALAGAGVKALAVRAREAAEAGRHRRTDGNYEQRRTLALAVQLTSGQWLSGTIPIPPRDPWLNVRLGAATAALYLIVLGASLIVIRQVTSPLQSLTAAARAFRGKAAPTPLQPVGPEDTREAIGAFNEMNSRLLALLDEKDRFLGAIGHDLRTPLASLRLRLEAMEPEVERAAAVRKVEEMTAILEDILTLAKTGRARTGMRATDIASIVEAVVDEHRDLGRQVAFQHGARVVADVHPSLLRRAISNLIDNAINFGAEASVNLRCTTTSLLIEVADRGPGIEPALMAKVGEPFFRAEPSRNRETGGSGLGLSIARSVAEMHGGDLLLTNRPEGGLSATLSLPLGCAKPGP